VPVVAEPTAGKERLETITKSRPSAKGRRPPTRGAKRASNADAAADDDDGDDGADDGATAAPTLSAAAPAPVFAPAAEPMALPTPTPTPPTTSAKPKASVDLFGDLLGDDVPAPKAAAKVDPSFMAGPSFDPFARPKKAPGATAEKAAAQVEAESAVAGLFGGSKGKSAKELADSLFD
jgi:hypothetical protein